MKIRSFDGVRASLFGEFTEGVLVKKAFSFISGAHFPSPGVEFVKKNKPLT